MKDKKKNAIYAYIGDGLNDAPVIARADCGISMGLKGSTGAIETSDVVFMNDDIGKLTTVIKLSRFTRRIIVINLIFAVLTKISFMVLAVLGLTEMYWAVFADVGVTILTILNSLRILKFD